MSNTSHGEHMTQAEIKNHGKRRRLAKKALREKNRDQLTVQTDTPSNCQSSLESVEQELACRMEMTSAQVRFIRDQLPIILNRLRKITDPRQAKKCKHQLAVLMLLGILSFVYQSSSRRKTNQQFTLPSFMIILKRFFPELTAIPHTDTLNRLLAQLGDDVEQIQEALLNLILQWIRKKKFMRFLVDNHYTIAFDGSQKMKRHHCWDERCSHRNVKHKKEPMTQYYVYVLEANLVFSNGMSIPFLTEVLEYHPDDQAYAGQSDEQMKQDCETKAFKRLAKRLKQRCPRLRIMVLLDGLYASGPVIELCRQYRWQFMIVLQDKSLKSVWEQANGLISLVPKNQLTQRWRGRQQRFVWANDIDYEYDHDRKIQTVHVVICEESWEDVDEKTHEIISKTSRHAWISSEPVHQKNVHARCNLAARYRWNIELSFLEEKHHGYHYEHCFSYDWNAMKGFHYLMRIAHALNALARATKAIAKYIRQMGRQNFIEFVVTSYYILGFLPNIHEQLIEELNKPFQIRLA